MAEEKDARVTSEGEAAEKERETRAEGQRLPPVDFAGFVLGLGEMALVHLGELPDHQAGRPVQDLEQARHTIDILDMLQVKTRGNLGSDEEQLLRSLLSDLKLRYVRLLK